MQEKLRNECEAPPLQCLDSQSPCQNMPESQGGGKDTKIPFFFFFFRENRFHVGGEQHNWHVCNVRSRAGRGVWRKSEIMLACGVSSINAV